MKLCPKCQAENRDAAKFCQNCQAALVTSQFCPTCGATNGIHARFCRACGISLHPTGLPNVIASGQPSISPLTAAPPTGGLQVDIVLSSRYRVKKKLGQGGMGAVYLVEDIRLGSRLLALKEMSDHAILDPFEKQKARDAFKQEATLLSDLSHPNLPRVTDFFDEGEKLYLVMDYVEGITLDDLLSAHTQPFSEGQVLNWAQQICEVLAYLHRHNPPVIYRDLKPGNIMISPDGQTAKIIDFGIARIFKPGSKKDTVIIGTPGYAPPEQYGKGQSDPRSDVYALGALLHHLLTLRDPADEPFQFPSIRSLNPVISPSTEAAIQRAVQQLKENRWQSITEFQQALCGQAAPIIYQPVIPVTVMNAAGVGAFPQSYNVVSQNSAPASIPWSVPVQPANPPAASALSGPATAAPLMSRAGAFILDRFIVGIGALLIGFGLDSLRNQSMAIFYLCVFGLYLVYYGIPQARSGQTLGKKIGNIKVVTGDGHLMGFGRSILRMLVCFGLPIAAGYYAVQYFFTSQGAPSIVSIYMNSILFPIYELGPDSEIMIYVNRLIISIFMLDAPYSFLLFVIPLLNKQRLGLHDWLAGTKVISTSAAPAANFAQAALSPASLITASLGARFGAYFVDGFFAGTASYVISFVFQSSMDEAGSVILYILMMLGFYFVYYALPISSTGQTMGKKSAHIKVVRCDGRPVSLGTAVWRTMLCFGLPVLVTFPAFILAGQAISILFPILSLMILASPLSNPQHRGVHDFLADTRVVKV